MIALSTEVPLGGTALNATIYDRGIARRLDRDFEDDLRHARQVSYEAWRHRGLMTRVREILTLPIRSQM